MLHRRREAVDAGREGAGEDVVGEVKEAKPCAGVERGGREGAGEVVTRSRPAKGWALPSLASSSRSKTGSKQVERQQVPNIVLFFFREKKWRGAIQRVGAWLFTREIGFVLYNSGKSACQSTQSFELWNFLFYNEHKTILYAERRRVS